MNLTRSIYRKPVLLLSLAFLALVVTGPLDALGGGERATDDDFSIAVFVPGVVEGSPTYEMLVAGVQRAAGERPGTRARVIEGGFNQAEWPQSITSLAATGDYDLIVTSNPSMPEIADEVSQSFPNQRFLVLDGYLAGNPGLYTVLFNQREQAFLSGYFAGLVSGSSMEHARRGVRAGLLAGQEYPIMNRVIRPAFELGIQSVDPAATVDFRVLGNWYDAAAATELANSMIDNGADIILTISGGGNQGVISAARTKGAYVLWYDSPGYDEAPGIVIGSTVVRLDEAAYRRTLDAIDGTLSFGSAEVLGVADGFVDFDTQHRLYERHVPAAVRQELEAMVRRLREGDLLLEMPTQF